MSQRLRVSIVGGSGYGGGEALRLLLGHTGVEVVQVTSRSQAGSNVSSIHPNLRGFTRLQFVRPDELMPCDVLFLCLPHGEAVRQIEKWQGVAGRIIDLSADFRLRSPDAYRRWYGEEHGSPAWLDRFTYGLPELHRDRLRKAKLASGVGCNATAMNLALLPFARRGLVQSALCDIKVGSSEAGNATNPGSHHPERAGAVRSYSPAGHRHAAEVQQELMSEAPFRLDVAVTAVEMVRGVLCTAHIMPTRPLDEKEIWRMLRESYGEEPFVRIVRERSGIYRLPEPKVVAGTNFCDIGFEIDASTGRVVVITAIDNLMKGAAGTAVQCMNLMCGFDEREGLWFPGLHPA